MLSGVKPTGKPHLGNYVGAMKQFVDLQDDYKGYFMVADYHAFTTLQNPQELKKNTLGIAMDYIAIGLNPKTSTIFQQSAVSEHTELTWIFNCITTMPTLMRAHAFKDAQAKNKEINVGVFDYPILMSTDILMYDPDIVPVGQDQKQHVEMARDIAEKFNRHFGETFTLPKEHIVKEYATIPGTDGRKMSKSYNNTISLFAEDSEIEKKVMSIITDSKGEFEEKDPMKCTVFALHKFFSKKDLQEIKKQYLEGKISYKESKEVLIENLKTFITPLRKKRNELEANEDVIIKILKEGGERARTEAEKKMQVVRERIGVSLVKNNE